MSATDAILAYATAEIGKPYVFGDEGPNTFDCSGLVQWVLGKVGIRAPRTAREQQAWARPVTNPVPGDLVFYNTPATHVGIYLGDGRMIDAPQPGARVRIDPVGTPTGYGRIPGLAGVVAPVVGAVTGAADVVGDTVAGWLAGGRHIAIEGGFVVLGLLLLGAGAWVAITTTRRAHRGQG